MVLIGKINSAASAIPTIGFLLTKLNSSAIITLVLLSWGRSSAGRAFDWQSRGHGFDPHRLHQVRAKFALLWLIFLSTTEKISHPPAPLLLLFRKKSRSAHLFGCKLPHHGSLSLPTFCEFESSTPTSENAKISFSCGLDATNKSEPCAGWRRVRIYCCCVFIFVRLIISPVSFLKGITAKKPLPSHHKAWYNLQKPKRKLHACI